MRTKRLLQILLYIIYLKSVCTEPSANPGESAQFRSSAPITYDIKAEKLARYMELLHPEPDEKKFPPAYLSELARQCVADTPSYSEFLYKAYLAFNEFCFKPEKYTYSPKIYWLALESINLSSLATPILFAIIISGLRYWITNLFLTTKYGRELESEKKRRKATTSLWNFLGYSCLMCADSFVFIQLGYPDFQYPLCIFDTIRFKPGYFESLIPSEYYYLYMLQLGFYIHSIYAVIFLDVRRKDTTISAVHHIITIFLLGFSLVVRVYRIGALVLFLHDISDIFLELGKFVVALRNHGPRRRAVCEVIANILFAWFTLSWFLLRIYWFPLKVLYSTTWGVYLTHLGREAHFFLFFNSMLWLLFGLHMYWSYFIVKMLLRIIFGKMPSLEDSRELDCDSPPTPELHSKSFNENHINSYKKRK